MKGRGRWVGMLVGNGDNKLKEKEIREARRSNTREWLRWGGGRDGKEK